MSVNIDESPVENGEKNQHQYAAQELATIRIELDRLSHDVRMKTIGAGAQCREAAHALDENVKQLAARVNHGQEAQEALMADAKALHERLRQLASQIALSIH